MLIVLPFKVTTNMEMFEVSGTPWGSKGAVSDDKGDCWGLL